MAKRVKQKKRRVRVRAPKVTEPKYLDTIKFVDDYLGMQDWRVRENANIAYSFSSLFLQAAGETIARYTLSRVYPREVARAHLGGDFHIHNLPFGITGYCAGWSIKDLLLRGFSGVPGRTESSPSRHFSSALLQISNFLGSVQNEWAGAQAVNSLDIYLAPFVRKDGLSYKQVKQAMQEFIYNLNISSRWGGQTLFTNVTFELKVPEDMKKEAVIYGGKALDETYADYQPEADLINRAFLDVMLHGDMRGRIFSFPIPTYNITRDFDWDSEVSNLLFQVTAKFGTPYFQNCIKGGIDSREVRAMCCRLMLDTKELHRRYGGFFGYADKTGSIGVCTINMPRLGYLSKDERGFFQRLERLMELAKESLEIKRKLVEQNMKRGLLPFSARYLGTLKFHFSTIGLVGMHEACLNFLGEGIETKAGKEFAIRVLKFMRERLVGFQNETGNIYNLEATPAEGTSHRLARLDKKRYPKITTAGKKVPYYTNCLSGDTEVLTKEGWKTHDELKIGDEVLTYNLVTKTLEYQKIQNLYRYNGECEMANIKSKAQDQLVTLNHMVLFESGARKGFEFLAPAACLPKMNFMIRMGASWGIQKDNQEYSDDLLRLIAWIVTEGYFERDCDSIRIVQSRKSKHWEEIKSMLDRLGVKYSILGSGEGKHKDSIFRISARDGKWIRKIINKKDVPRELLNSLSERQLNLLLLELAKGDGVVRNRYPIRIYTGSAKLAGKYQEIAIKTNKRSAIGYGANAYYVDIVNPRCKSWIMEPPKRVKYKGTVWCVEVPNHTFVARRNGRPFITGNSTHLPVGYTNNLIEALRHQENLQVLYNGGTVLHCFLGEAVSSAEGCKELVRKIAENFKLPYYTITPTFSICMEHGYLRGEHFKCPRCGKPAEVYSRIVGYYRPVANWHVGKQQEFRERLEYDERLSIKSLP